jgi:preprotein translocase subunit SecA
MPEVTERVYEKMIGNYNRKVDIISKQAFPVIKNVYETKGQQYHNIVVPFPMESGFSRLFAISKKHT